MKNFGFKLVILVLCSAVWGCAKNDQSSSQQGQQESQAGTYNQSSQTQAQASPPLSDAALVQATLQVAPNAGEVWVQASNQGSSLAPKMTEVLNWMTVSPKWVVSDLSELLDGDPETILQMKHFRKLVYPGDSRYYFNRDSGQVVVLKSSGEMVLGTYSGDRLSWTYRQVIIVDAYGVVVRNYQFEHR